MSKILISGYYGFNNLGDEAILESIINNLKKTFKDVEIVVLSENPQVTSDKYHIESISRKNILAIIKAIKNCDLLISGGGSLLQDITSKRSIYYYLGIIALGVAMNKKVMIYSQGIGPIHKKINRKLTSFLLNKVNFITVRDYNSKKDLIEMGIKKENIVVTTDPVISMEKIDKNIGLEILKEECPNFDSSIPTIGFAFRGRNYTPKFRKVLIDAIKELLDELNVNIVFIPFHYSEDIEINNDLENVFKDKVIFINKRYEAKQVLSIIENLDLLVGVRLHSLIFSAMANVPMIAISYDPKIDYFMETLGLKSLCSVEELTKEELVDSIKYMFCKQKEFRDLIEKRIQNLKKIIAINEEHVKKLLK